MKSKINSTSIYGLSKNASVCSQYHKKIPIGSKRLLTMKLVARWWSVDGMRWWRAVGEGRRSLTTGGGGPKQ